MRKQDSGRDLLRARRGLAVVFGTHGVTEDAENRWR
jgi:hypothetical protein